MLDRLVATSRHSTGHRLQALLLPSSAILATILLAACGGPESSPPQQVQANNPTVTYQYRGDEELIKASESAGVYCSKFQSSAQAQSITDTPDGGKSAVFECVSNTGPAVPGQAQTLTPGTPYSYGSDQELIDRTRNADAYCASVGSHHAIATVSSTANGGRSVTFNCSSP